MSDFEALGLSDFASLETVEYLYPLLKDKYNPDKYEDSEKEWARNKLKEITDAYNTIMSNNENSAKSSLSISDEMTCINNPELRGNNNSQKSNYEINIPLKNDISRAETIYKNDKTSVIEQIVQPAVNKTKNRKYQQIAITSCICILVVSLIIMFFNSNALIKTILNSYAKKADTPKVSEVTEGNYENSPGYDAVKAADGQVSPAAADINNLESMPAASNNTASDTDILKTLILDFNSAWIRYVNNGSKDVLNFVVPSSESYKDIVSFNRTGRTQEFLEIKVNDVSIKNGNAYIKVYEKIRTVKKGKENISEFNWVYEAVKVNDKWLIKNYSPDTSS